MLHLYIATGNWLVGHLLCHINYIEQKHYFYIINIQLQFCYLDFSIFISSAAITYELPHTIDREKFAGLNIRGFSAIEVFTEIFLCCLDCKYSLFSTIKERHLYSHENFCSTPENREKHKSLAKRIFLRLRQLHSMIKICFASIPFAS